MSTPLFAFISTQTLVIVGLVGILLFGNKLPEMAKMLAKGIRSFQDGLSGREDEHDEVVRTPAPTMLPAPQRITQPSVSPIERNGIAAEPPLA
jgi:sec-independent protein translocase protein TatA